MSKLAPIAGPARSRREQTRAALITAAQEILAEAEIVPAVKAITDRAGVSVGSFYNHFDDKQALLNAAVNDALGEIERDIFEHQADIVDPAERFAVGVRIFGRAVERHPLAARVLVSTNAWHRISDRGASPRALDDVQRCVDAGVFTCSDLQTTMIIIAGGANRLLSYRLLTPEAGPELVDRSVATSLLLFGVTLDEAERLAFSPLELR